jgi:hypothetical protein
MKKLYIIILLLVSHQLLSQSVTTGIGRWKLGINIGTTWQTADLTTNLFDLGYGGTLEYALHEKQRSFFGFSLRGRFLQGKTTGYNCVKHDGDISNNAINGTLDTSINYSLKPLYLNNKTSLNEFSLEAMLKFNRLYQNKGILFYLYFGGGFTSYKVESDQLDISGNPYDYSFINNGNSSNTIKETKSLQDGIYETELINPNYNTLAFTPSAGVGLGFRITPGVDFALEHKISLPQTDLFDGQIEDSGDPSFVQDIYHYTSLGFIFSIIHHSEPETYTPISEPIEPITILPETPVVNAPIKPIITLIQPTLNTFNTPNCKIAININIQNVKTQNDITFYQNGNKVPSYKYFFSPPTFKSTVELADGNNVFKIVANNGSLSATKEFSLKCNNVNTIPICHKNGDGTSSTINIKETDWLVHAAHGDIKSSCAEKQISICHNISGQPGKTQTININESKWLLHKSHGDYIGGCQEKKKIIICHNNQTITIDEKDWAIHASHGDTKGACPKINMITICHIPTTGSQRQTLTIPENEWIVHQAHGDSKGTCPTIETMTTICHKNSLGTKTTITIPEFRWNEHFSHGDSKGDCPQSSFIICHKDPTTGKKSNISIYESSWAKHASHGDTKWACPVIEKQITICHNIPGQPGKTQTIAIPESKWLLHKSHGDSKGTCIASTTETGANLDIPFNICHTNSNGIQTTLKVTQKEWQTHRLHGDIKGVCVPKDNDIQICHHSGNILSQMTIKESQWAQHAAHGDTKGICPKDNSTSDPIDPGNGSTGSGNDNITICHHPPGNPTNTQTISISASAWKAHQAHGDTQGICPKDNSTNDPNDPSNGNTGNTGGNNKITICHHPPGNPTNLQTIEISTSEWKAHQAHGDTVGACPNAKEIKESGSKTLKGKKGN